MGELQHMFYCHVDADHCLITCCGISYFVEDCAIIQVIYDMLLYRIFSYLFIRINSLTHRKYGSNWKV